jgi:acyl-coenzyme A synthetase/AMP-(fatty) acid ligase
MNQLADAIPNVATTLIDTLIASNRGDRHAFSYNDRRYSYQDVAALMNRTANLVKELGVEQGASVLLLLPPSPALVASLLGVIKAGAVAVLGAPSDSGALERCVAKIRPSAAIVHENHLAGAETALATIPQDAILVVGTTAPDRYKSFLQEVRRQPSWLAAQDVARDAPALRLWTGSGVDEVSHAGLAAFIDGGGRIDGGSTEALGHEAAAIGAMLRAFSRGEEATLS